MTTVIDSPVGKLGIKTDGVNVLSIEFLKHSTKTSLPSDIVAESVVEQLKGYFADPDYDISLPLELTVTPFQLRVLTALQSIPVGNTKSYGELAKQLKTSARAIGMACRQNPVPIIIPCHRIVAANGIGGFAGKTDGKELRNKQWLLNHESK